MNNPNSERDVQPLDLLDVLRSVQDAMNLSNLRWLLYDENRRSQWFVDLGRGRSPSRLGGAVDPEVTSPPDMDDIDRLPSTKRPARAVSAESTIVEPSRA